ncbi:6,7-dimethyl-8-ribityllumazine synthase [Gloeobacter kilaueensis]|uniref:6,7-dimethyl-8-ribityllumazine synthase n=1 Tax=Gloeobacter kilaueensis (strain ATCC BAA-2537 / CCAP 1431/1 / ULC 316 / JS1) TaxID=1183438 RepID=U5QMT0_GLOK1|nr:6,7-dimethyl-8-ribityllumazine synthase [Gloeobacter kilaueensis]AGY60208.1 6,7-dimethyl-8-ribityllumazine synthase [Gloeobacter kilaueensis JS1]
MTTFEGHFQDTADLKFAIVIARFNDLVTGKLLSACEDALTRHGITVGPASSQVDYAWVPGSFEIPMVARLLALSGRYDAIICLGAVIRGQTSHYDHVASEVAKGIQTLAYQTGVPITFGVLTTDTLQQALERAGIKNNLGWEYGMNAIEMANLTRKLRHLALPEQSAPNLLK